MLNIWHHCKQLVQLTCCYFFLFQVCLASLDCLINTLYINFYFQRVFNFIKGLSFKGFLILDMLSE